MKAKATHFPRELLLPFVVAVVLMLPCCHTIGADEQMLLLTNQPNTTFSARLTGEFQDDDEGWSELGKATEKTGAGQYKLMVRLRKGRRYDLKAENPGYEMKTVKLTEPIDRFSIPFYPSERKNGRGRRTRPPDPEPTPTPVPDPVPPRPGPYKPPVERWALIVGIDEYNDKKIPAIAYAEEDAREMREFLVAEAGYPNDHVYLLTGPTATAENIRIALREDLRKKAQTEDDLLVYFACHGMVVPDPKSGNNDSLEKYLLAYDTDTKKLRVDGISMKELKSSLDEIECGQVALILDTCFSGGARSVIGGGTRNTTVTSDYLAKLIERSGAKHRKVLTACEANELAQDDPKGHGIFTLCLLEALRSGKDTDKDGNLSLYEVWQHLDRPVRDRSAEVGQRQNPKYTGQSSYPFVIRKIRK